MIHFTARWWWVIATILFLALLAGTGGPSKSAPRRFRHRRERRGDQRTHEASVRRRLFAPAVRDATPTRLETAAHALADLRAGGKSAPI
jgi:hypothetical protein